jgi:peptide/nickel transport system substrate-binding protein
MDDLKRIGGLLACWTLSAVFALQPALASDTPRRGGTVAVAVDGTSLGTLNTQITSATPVLMIADIWADGLFARDEQAHKVPHLATSWEVSPDRLTYTFHLRTGVKWSDGEPFTSADVAFTLTDVAKFNTYQVQTVANVASVETPDDATVVVHAKQPLAVMLDAFDKEIFPIVPKHIFANTDIIQNPANRMPIGLGPFKLQTWDAGRALVFVRNPYFWDSPKPYMDRVIVGIIPDMQQQANALIRGEIDFLKLVYSQIDHIKQAGAATGKVAVHKVAISAPGRSTIDFNTTRGPLRDVRVRQALLMAMDRNRIVATTYHGYAIPAGNAIPEQFPDLTDPTVKYSELYPYDPAKAAALLDEAGYKLVDGKRFTLELAYSSSQFDRALLEPTAQILAAQWGAIGVEVKLASTDAQIWVDKVYKQRNFDTSIVSLTGGMDPVFGVDRGFLCNKGFIPYVNPTGYCNPELDEFALKAKYAPPDERKNFYKQYIQIVARDLNEISMTNASTYFGYSTRFNGLEAQLSVAFNEYPNWAEVWLPGGQ